MTGLPAGVNGSVALTGPAGAQTGTATANMTVKSGDYTFAISSVGDADAIVRKAFKGTLSAATARVCDGQTVGVTATYAPIASSNKMW